MSITAEKIMVALQNVNERNGGAPYEAINKWQREVLSEQAEAILSLLQQGEPEGWRRIADEALRKYAKSLRVSEAKRPGSTYGMLKPEAVEEAADCLKNSFLSASPLPPAPGAETGGKKLDIDRDWCIEAAKREEAAGDPDCSVGTFLVPPSPEQEEYLDKVKTLGTEYDRSAIIFSSRQAVLEEKDNS